MGEVIISRLYVDAAEARATPSYRTLTVASLHIVRRARPRYACQKKLSILLFVENASTDLIQQWTKSTTMAVKRTGSTMWRINGFESRNLT